MTKDLTARDVVACCKDGELTDAEKAAAVVAFADNQNRNLLFQVNSGIEAAARSQVYRERVNLLLACIEPIIETLKAEGLASTAAVLKISSDAVKECR